jgi:hypothetical protein
VTGWAQVMGGTLVTAEEKDALDVWYIHHASPTLDLKIIIRTLKVVFHGENKHHDEIESAVKWCEKLRQINQFVFDDGLKANPNYSRGSGVGHRLPLKREANSVDGADRSPSPGFDHGSDGSVESLAAHPLRKPLVILR